MTLITIVSVLSRESHAGTVVLGSNLQPFIHPDPSPNLTLTLTLDFPQDKATPGAGGAVYKYDVVQRQVIGIHEFALPQQKGRLVAGECLFVCGDGENEDSGYLMTVATDEVTMTSFLYIVDAATMTTDAVAIVQLPQRVPFGFHGTWVPHTHMS